jgi:hypothetical protein
LPPHRILTQELAKDIAHLPNRHPFGDAVMADYYRLQIRPALKKVCFLVPRRGFPKQLERIHRRIMRIGNASRIHRDQPWIGPAHFQDAIAAEGRRGPAHADENGERDCDSYGRHGNASLSLRCSSAAVMLLFTPSRYEFHHAAATSSRASSAIFLLRVALPLWHARALASIADFLLVEHDIAGIVLDFEFQPEPSAITVQAMITASGSVENASFLTFWSSLRSYL